jgi:predicted nucleotidyltransferase
LGSDSKAGFDASRDFYRPELENYLSDTFGIKVDLVLKSVLKNNIEKNILNEAIPV